MRAELIVSCKRSGVAGVLKDLYGPHDAGALSASALARKAPDTATSIQYAARTRGLIVMAEFIGDKKATLYIESSGGLLRQGVEDVWGELHNRGKPLEARLQRLQLIDEDASDIIATAGVGLLGSVRRDDTIGPIVTGIVTTLVLVVAWLTGNATPEFLYGSATALGVAILYVAGILWSARSKKLVWR